jgi:hypothetical protein
VFQEVLEAEPKEPSIEKHTENHHKYCSSECLKVFTQCLKEQEELERQESQSQRKELHFPTVDAALDWIRGHKTEVAIGTVVIVGGIVAAPYVIAVMGGALVLAPL